MASDRAAGRPRCRLRAAGLRRLLADRAPLPARGLRGRAQRDPVRRHAGRRGPPRIRIGTMFNIVPQWHPLRLAEDFAYLHNVSGGRALFGVGRGTVPREAETLGTPHRLLRQPRPGRRRPAQPRAVRRGHRGHPYRLRERAVQVRRPALHVPAARDPRPGRLRGAPHARPPAPPPRRVVAGRHVTADPRGRAPQGLRRGVLAEAPRRRAHLVGALRGAATPTHQGDELAPGEKRMLVAVLPHRGQPRGGHGLGPRRPRRVLEVPRPLRLVAGVPAPRRPPACRPA